MQRHDRVILTWLVARHLVAEDVRILFWNGNAAADQVARVRARHCLSRVTGREL